MIFSIKVQFEVFWSEFIIARRSALMSFLSSSTLTHICFMLLSSDLFMTSRGPSNGSGSDLIAGQYLMAEGPFYE
jgi:hypothetical protein